MYSDDTTKKSCIGVKELLVHDLVSLTRKTDEELDLYLVDVDDLDVNKLNEREVQKIFYVRNKNCILIS